MTRTLNASYLQAFKKGVYNYIKDEQDPLTQESIPRKYFSGGVVMRFGIEANNAMATVHTLDMAQLGGTAHLLRISSNLTAQGGANPAMISAQDIEDNALSEILGELRRDKVANASRLEELERIWKGKISEFIEKSSKKEGKSLFRMAAKSFHPDMQQTDQSFENLSVACKVFIYVIGVLESSQGSTDFSKDLRRDVSAVYMDYHKIMSRNALKHRIEELKEQEKSARERGLEFLEPMTPGNLRVRLKSGEVITFNNVSAVSLFIFSEIWLGDLYIATLQDGYPVYFMLDLSGIKAQEKISERMLRAPVKREFGFYREPTPIMNRSEIKKAIDNIIRQNDGEEKGFYSKFSFKEPEMDGRFEVTCYGKTIKFDNVLGIFAQGLIYLVYKQDDFLEYVVLGYKLSPEGLRQGFSEIVGDAQAAFMSIYQYDLERHQKGRSAFIESLAENGEGNGLSADNEAMASNAEQTWEAAQENMRILFQQLDREASSLSKTGGRAQKKVKDKAQLSGLDNAKLKGGIDLTPANMKLQTQNAGEGIKFHIEPAQLAQLQNAPGFTPVIISIQSVGDLQEFLLNA